MTNTMICSIAGFNKSIELSSAEFETLQYASLEDLRKFLIQKNFFSGYSQLDSEWRFVSPNVDSKDVQVYNARIIGKELEESINVKKLLSKMPTKEIILTDINRSVKPDLMGFAADWFMGGDLRIKCLLNQRDEKTKAANSDKFPPFMLTNVMSTAERSSNFFYENVCVFCKDSIIEFKVRCFGKLGFAYKCNIAGNGELRSNGVRWRDGFSDVFGETSFYAWNNDEAIVMKAVSDAQHIDNENKMAYIKLTFKAVSMNSWRDLNSGVIHRGPLKNTMRRTASSQIVIGGDDVVPGTPTKGDKQHVNYGPWAIHETDDWNTTANHLDVYCFVFDKLEHAKKYFDKYNWCPLNEQAKIMGV